MNIGEVSSRSGVSQRMIRHYEKVGLVPRAARRASGYRDYGDDDVHRLRFVRRARDLGFGIEEIRRLLALWEDRERSSAEVKALALTRAGELRRKEQEMASMRRTLEALARSCSGNERPDCPILDDLAAADGA
jgi:MerR family transcriptional regulator, copper efflux regulator